MHLKLSKGPSTSAGEMVYAGFGYVDRKFDYFLKNNTSLFDTLYCTGISRCLVIFVSTEFASFFLHMYVNLPYIGRQRSSGH